MKNETIKLQVTFTNEIATEDDTWYSFLCVKAIQQNGSVNPFDNIFRTNKWFDNQAKDKYKVIVKIINNDNSKKK